MMNDDAKRWEGPSPREPLAPDVGFLRMAWQVARASEPTGEVPVGAVVVRDGRVLASAHNARESEADPAGHAELIAMRRAARLLGDWRLEGCTVYVTLEPCPMCAGAMVQARIARCVYGCTDPKAGFLGSLGDLSNHAHLNHRFDVVAGILAEPCALQLRSAYGEFRHRAAWYAHR